MNQYFWNLYALLLQLDKDTTGWKVGSQLLLADMLANSKRNKELT
jgi:hypothetical protein